jgi:surface antigen
MKNTFVKLALVATIGSIGITGCSTNTQGQNTAVGAVGGAVVGGLAGSAVGGGAAVAVGAVAGALLGGFIGHSMDSTDKPHMYSAMDNPTNTPTTWKNQKSGAVYTVTPTSGMMAVDGNKNCRKYVTTVTKASGKTKRTHGIACKQADGSWMALR